MLARSSGADGDSFRASSSSSPAVPAWVGWTEGEGPYGQGSYGGQGLTPHRTWPQRVPQSGPGSWLQLQGEDKE